MAALGDLGVLETLDFLLGGGEDAGEGTGDLPITETIPRVQPCLAAVSFMFLIAAALAWSSLCSSHTQIFLVHPVNLHWSPAGALVQFWWCVFFQVILGSKQFRHILMEMAVCLLLYVVLAKKFGHPIGDESRWFLKYG